MVRLSEVFLAHIGTDRAARFLRLTSLDESLAALLQAGRSAWPGIDVPPEDFFQRMAKGLPEDGDPLEAVNTTHAEDLYLACACTRGDVAAFAEFEKTFMSRTVAEIVRSKVAPDMADEALQRLRMRLLMADGDEPPRIAGYHGRGPLAGWLFVAAARIAIDLRRSERDHTELGDVLWNVVGETDPEMGYLKVRYGKELELALREALLKLSPREMAVLRLTFQQDMTGDALADIYRVSRRTVVRWLTEIRQCVMDETRRVLAARLQLSSAELESLVELVVSRINVSLQGQVEPGVDD